MKKKNVCEKCGHLFSKEVPYDLCPRCLMSLGLNKSAQEAPDASLEIEGQGSCISSYQLLEQIGEGGMGQVFLAEQKDPIVRKVALKIVKLGMDTMQVVARFRSEQQMLAMLEHPNIAKVYDAGTTLSGRPYFVMEHVDGVPITEYCDSRHLNIDERLQLFLQVCGAIQHAHQKGILHRDIKPSNILVTGDKKAPIPKIIDFGIAKAISQPMISKKAITDQGQMVGTPEYMSPEQVDMADQYIDIRSDVYSLGVVLYELLSGAPPFDGNTLRKDGLDNLRRVIRDQEPLTPSARLTEMENRVREIAENRGTEPQVLSRRLKKELEWIPIKAMRKDPRERYQSVSALAEDVVNYQDGGALTAGPQTKLYKIRIFIRKHATLVVMGAMLAVTLVSGLISTTTMYLRADTMRTVAVKERELAQDQSEEYRRLLYIYKVALADAKYRDQNVRSVRKLLKDCPEDLRNWEWHRLEYILDESILTLTPDEVSVTFAVSPDGRMIATGGAAIALWDIESGTNEVRFKGSDNMFVFALAFHPDGQRLISGSDKTVQIWDTNTGEKISTLSGHEHRVMSVVVSPDGKQIASASFDKSIKLWDASTGREIRTLRGHENYVMKVSFSPDGHRIASGGFDGTVRIWDTDSGKQLKIFRQGDQQIISLAYCPDSEKLAIGTKQGTIKILDAETGEDITVTNGHGWHQSLTTALAYSPDGKRLVSGSFDQTVRVWDVTTGEELAALVGHENGIWGVAFTPDGKRIVSSSFDRRIKIWDIDMKDKCVILTGHQKPVYHLAFTHDGKHLISSGEDAAIKLWDLSENRELQTFRGHDDSVWEVASCSDGKHIVSCSNDKTIRVWDLKAGLEVQKIQAHDNPVYSVAVSPDDQLFASGSIKEVKIWDARTGKEILSFSTKEYVHSLAFSPDGKRIAATDGDEAIRMWELSTGKEIFSLTGHKGVICTVRFTPDGSRIVSGAYDGTVRIWDSSTGKQLMNLIGHKSSNIGCLALSPDGTRIVSGTFTKTKLWDIETGAELMTISANHGALALAFSPDGKTIACADDQTQKTNNITLWKSGPSPSQDR